MSDKTQPETTERATGEPAQEENLATPVAENSAPEEDFAGPMMDPAGESQENRRHGQADTFWARQFDSWGRIAPLCFLILLALMVWANFLHPAQALYCPAEAKYISAFLHGIQEQSWIAPMSVDQGAFSLAQWPMFYWLLAGLAAIPGLAEHTLILPLAGAISAALVLIGAWGLTRAARLGAAASFATGLILICAPIFAPMSAFVGPTALSTALMLFALLFFCRGWIRNRAWFSLPLAFIFTALAGLSGGPLFCLTPLLASFFFLIWRAAPRRAQAADALFGFIIFLAILGAWFVMLNVNSIHNNYLQSIWDQAFHNPRPLQPHWWLVFAIACAGLLPWLLEILGVSWLRVLTSIPRDLSASRHDNGSALLWIAIAVCSCLALCTTSAPVAALAIACLAAPLLGRAFANLPPPGNRFLFLLAAIIAIIAGIYAVCLSFPATQNLLLGICPLTPPKEWLEVLGSLRGLTVIGAILLLGGLYMFVFVRRYQAGGGLVYSALLTVVLCQPALLMVVPELGKMPQARLVTISGVERMVASAAKPAVPAEKAVVKPAPAQAAPEAEPAPESPAAGASGAVKPAAPAETAPEAMPAAPAQAAPEAEPAAPIVAAPEASPGARPAVAAPADTQVPAAADTAEVPAEPQAAQQPAKVEETATPGASPSQPEATSPQADPANQ